MIPREAKLQLYQSAILPDLTYCHIVWHFCKASNARKLGRVQEWALRAVYNREFKIRRLRTTTTVKHATAPDQNHVTVRFSRVVLRLR